MRQPGSGQDLPLLATLILLLGIAVLPPHANGVPLLQKMESSPLISQFTTMLKASGMGHQMNTTGTCSVIRCFLVFAPTNEAITAAFQADPATFNALDQETLMKHHYLTAFPGGTKGVLSAWAGLGTPIGEDIGFGQVQILKTGQSTLFWLAKQTGSSWSYRINNAAIVVAESNQDADNGVYHVLDQVALPIGSQVAFNDFITVPDSLSSKQLSVSKSLKIFSEWKQRDAAKAYVYGALVSNNPYKVRTVFLPSDAAWDRIPQAKIQQLNSSIEEFRNVFMAHFAPDICVFTSWMTLGSSITFKTGLTGEQQYDAKMYLDSHKKAFVSVGGVVAQFDGKSINYPIGDTVIHVVDRVLAFTYDTLASLAEMNAPAFYSSCVAVASCKALLESNNTQRTLFAPSDLNSLNGANASQVEQILKMHFVPRYISRPDMNETDLVATQENLGEIRFRMAQNRTKFYVEGRLANRGFVRSELLMYDQPSKNGIFHKIAFPVGQPMQTVKDFINSYADLSTVSPFMGADTFEPNLGTGTGPYTVFPPNNAAMAAFKAHKSSTGATIGQTILNDKKLSDRVLRRMVLPNERIVADVAPAGLNEYPTANTAENEKVSLNLVGAAGLRTRTVELTGVFVKATVNLTVGEYECTNGMVYPTGAVLFRDSDIEGYTRSGVAVASSLTVALLTALLACVAWL